MRVLIPAAACAVAVALLAGPLAAGVPSGLADLVGLKGRDGEAELQSRGYTFHHGAEATTGKSTVWWNSGAKSCIAVLTEDGRYTTIDARPVEECAGEPR